MPVVDVSLQIPCPICGAAPDEKCELHSGYERFESHRERRDLIRDLELRPEGSKDAIPLRAHKRSRPHPTSVA